MIFYFGFVRTQRRTKRQNRTTYIRVKDMGKKYLSLLAAAIRFLTVTIILICLSSGGLRLDDQLQKELEQALEANAANQFPMFSFADSSSNECSSHSPKTVCTSETHQTVCLYCQEPMSEAAAHSTAKTLANGTAIINGKFYVIVNDICACRYVMHSRYESVELK